MVAPFGPAMADDPTLSIVVPIYDEEPNVGPLVSEVRAALEGKGSWELLLVDDGSTDGSALRAEREAANDPRVQLIQLARNFGQSVALQAGFERSDGEVVVSMDGDLQNDPRDIPTLVDRLADGFDIVAGYREERRDSLLTRQLPSRAANALVRWLTGVPVHDNGCTLRAYRREVLERLSLYSDHHRFLVPLAVATSGARVSEVPVRHRPRRAGRSKYGLSRTWKVLADLLTVKAIRSFRERPLTLFGLAAAVLSVLGLGAGAAGLALRATTEVVTIRQSFVLPSIALLCLQVAAFLVMLGLVAEVALRGRWMRRGLSDPVVHEWGR